MFDHITERRTARRGSRTGNNPNTHPATTRTYLLRGMLICGCGRRLFGNQRRGLTYYTCYPRNNNRGRVDNYPGHPATVYVRESAILDAVAAVYADRVFGENRRDILARDIAKLDDRETQTRQAERERHQCTLTDLTRRQDNVLRQAQDADPNDPFTAGLRQTYNDLDTQRKTTLALLEQLDQADQTQPARPSSADAALLDALPYLALNLIGAREPLLRRLFEITKLTVRIRPDTQDATIEITRPADTLDDVAETAERITMSDRHRLAKRADAVRAPGRICRRWERASRSGWLMAARRIDVYGVTRALMLVRLEMELIRRRSTPDLTAPPRDRQ